MQATVELTIVDIYSQLVPVAISKTSSWQLIQTVPYPTYQNAIVLPSTNKIKQRLDTIRYQLSLNTMHPDFTKTTAFRNLVLPKHATTGFHQIDHLSPRNQISQPNLYSKIRKLPELLEM
ncbi:hypothetical protein F511_25167 [Dorcoceras hygrometricum]|uniref:Uncharacterized protein n=1 Tax=Dorcoceras hygrometricum TaxID=472368 RepID=A0A2Z7B9I7_9LAMI|nr:hypothetical protein F511_25167 [Dorcoceras hygrometricum]